MEWQDLNQLFEGFLPWMSGLYDRESGGFYYAPSSLKDNRFAPDLESTSQGLNIIAMADMEDVLSQEIKAKMISFYRERQNSQGYFLDPHNEMYTVDRMVARALSYSLNALRRLGGTPKYPTPGMENKELPEHMQSLKKFRNWLENRPWDDAWMACDNISAASVYIRNMKADTAGEYLDLLLPWLDKKQDPQTGLWGEGRPYIKISGAFKLALLYRNLGYPMSRGENILRSLLETVEKDRPEDFCWIRNPIELLMVLKSQDICPTVKERETLMKITLENMHHFLRSDGGFSRGRESSLAMPNNQVLGQGLEEGDMNAGTQAVRIRRMFYWLEKKIQPPLPHRESLFSKEMAL